MKHISLSQARLDIPKVLNNHESAVILSKNSPIGVVVPYEQHESLMALSSLINNKLIDFALKSHIRAMAGDFSQTKDLDALDDLEEKIAPNQLVADA